MERMSLDVNKMTKDQLRQHILMLAMQLTQLEEENKAVGILNDEIRRVNENLREENKKLKEELRMLKEGATLYREDNKKLREEVEQLKNKRIFNSTEYDLITLTSTTPQWELRRK